MNNKEHRLGVSEINLVTRHLKLNARAVHAAVSDIDKLFGLDSVSFDDKKRKLHLVYDATRLCIDCVEKIFEKHAIKLSHNWWTRFKEEHYRFIDQNVKDNAKHEPWSCHQTPPGGARKR